MLKRAVAQVALVVLGLTLCGPAVAHAGSKTKQTKAQKDAQKQWNKYSKQYNKQQKKQLKAQQKQMKQRNKNQTIRVVT